MVFKKNYQDDITIDFIFDIMPSLSKLPYAIFDRINNEIKKTIDHISEISGVFVVSTVETQPLIYSKSLYDFESIKTIAEMLQSFNPQYLIKSLQMKGYHGMEHLSYPEFEIYFTKITDTEVLAVLVSSKKEAIKPIVEKIIMNIKNSLALEDTVRTLSSLPIPQNTLSSNDNTDNSSSVPRPPT
ncbi:MAG: hypothetical protein OEZ01_03390 [Candidatus Heimdallarchaeota archaeon]|nr:hypothetical protein [Candidatus Heimdallarchaeota archaeon]MDH5645021.1 hypothetical protein [Candidatus Heimdallarchaeota archaeon]